MFSSCMKALNRIEDMFMDGSKTSLKPSRRVLPASFDSETLKFKTFKLCSVFETRCTIRLIRSDETMDGTMRLRKTEIKRDTLSDAGKKYSHNTHSPKWFLKIAFRNCEAKGCVSGDCKLNLWLSRAMYLRVTTTHTQLYRQDRRENVLVHPHQTELVQDDHVELPIDGIRVLCSPT